MPFVDNTTAFEQKHTSSDEDNKYSYSSLTLNASLTDAAQLQVRYVPTTIYKGNTQGNSGTATATNSLTPRVLELLTVIPSTKFTVNADDDDVTFNVSALQDTSREIDGVTYYYGASLSISTTEPIILRRATSLNDKSVNFQAGSRLTSTSLNLAVDQLFNASQELTAFGGVGGGGTSAEELDLSGFSIQDLGDVVTFGSAGPLTWNTSTNQVEIGAAGSVPTPSASDNGKYLGVTDTLGNFSWVAFDIQGSDVAYDSTDSVNDKINSVVSDVSSNDTDITNLQTKTASMSYDASTGFTFTGDITNTPNDITTTNLNAVDITTSNELNLSPGSTSDTETNPIYGIKATSSSRFRVKTNGQTKHIHTATTDSRGHTTGEDNCYFLHNPHGYVYYIDPSDTGATTGGVQSNSSWLFIDPRRARSGESTVTMQRRVYTSTGGRTSFQFVENNNDDVSTYRFNRIYGNNDDFVDIRPDYVASSSSDVFRIYDASATTPVKFGVRGNGRCTSTSDFNGTAFNTTSDANLKDYNLGLTDLNSPENLIKNLNTFGHYKFLGDEEELVHYGPTAQDLESVGLDVVVREDENGYKQVDLGSLCGVLLEAVKNLTARVEELESQGE